MHKDNIGDALTERALTAYSRIENARLRELVTSLIRHLHAVVNETKLTHEEFELAWTLWRRWRSSLTIGATSSCCSWT